MIKIISYFLHGGSLPRTGSSQPGEVVQVVAAEHGCKVITNKFIFKQTLFYPSGPFLSLDDSTSHKKIGNI